MIDHYNASNTKQQNQLAKVSSEFLTFLLDYEIMGFLTLFFV